MSSTAPSARLSLQVRTWNLPALVMYFMPLKGLYFSPYISRRFTLSPGGKKEARSETCVSPRSSKPTVVWVCVSAHSSVWKRLANEPVLPRRGGQLCNLPTRIYSKGYISSQTALQGEAAFSVDRAERQAQTAVRVRQNNTEFAQVV